MKFEEENAVIINEHRSVELTKEEQKQRKKILVLYVILSLVLGGLFLKLIPPTINEADPQVQLETWGDATYSVQTLRPLADGGYQVIIVLDDNVSAYSEEMVQDLASHLLTALSTANDVEYRYLYLKVYDRFETWEDGSLLPDYEQYLVSSIILGAEEETVLPTEEELAVYLASEAATKPMNLN